MRQVNQLSRLKTYAPASKLAGGGNREDALLSQSNCRSCRARRQGTTRFVGRPKGEGEGVVPREILANAIYLSQREPVAAETYSLRRQFLDGKVPSSAMHQLITRNGVMLPND